MKRNMIIVFAFLFVLSMLIAPARSLAAPDAPKPIYIPVVLRNTASDSPSNLMSIQDKGIADVPVGQTITLQQTIPINLVFVGYDPYSVRQLELLSGLPTSYKPVVRYPLFYGVEGRDMGLEFNFKYQVIQTGQEFQDDFFAYLQGIGQAGDPTDYQLAYNDQNSNVLDVTGPVLYIDGPSVETWLTDHARPLLGRDPDKGYTIFFINWYTRPDFQFHVYTKTDQPDPDTGYNFGEVRASRKAIAWGGSNSRSWFYDLSAGPEAWTDNWYVDEKDLDGNGVEDYRMPPIWEYTPGGYRDPDQVTHDLGLVTRFVAINLLFTSSPLYDPLNTSPQPGGAKVAHISLFEDDPASSGVPWFNLGYIKNAWSTFEPYYNWQVNLQNTDPIDAGSQRAFRIWADILPEDDCWNAFGTTFAELFCYYDANLADYVPAYDPKDYVGPMFAFNTTSDNLGDEFGLLGYADDNWVDGAQTYVFEFDTQDYRDIGYGFSTTTVHEFGHHIGMSHPHDGYDASTGVDYGPADEFYFAWSGDESATIMSYMDLNQQFGNFDRDNMYRYEAAGYLNWAQQLYAQVRADPKWRSVNDLIMLSKEDGKQSVQYFMDWNYLSSVTKAWQAYQNMLLAADALGIQAPQQPQAVLPIGNVIHEGDPIRFPDN